MFPTFYLLLVLVVFPSEHIATWDTGSLHHQTDAKTFAMPSEKTCEAAAATVMANSQRGEYPEGTTVITRCHSVAAHQSSS
jgi:hypothetical protein